MLERLREQLDMFAATIPGVVYQFVVRADGEWAFTYVSPVVRSFFGVSPEDACAAHEAMSECVVPEDRAAHHASVNEANRRLQPWQHDFRIRSRSGELRWLRGQANPTAQADGSVLWHGVLTDITACKQAEMAMQVSETRFRNLLHSIPAVAVQGYTEDGTTHFWNKASEQLYGYTAEEAIGRKLLDLIIPAEMRSGVLAAIREMFATGQPIPAGELSLMRKDGSRIDVLSSHAYVHVPGQAAEMFCVDVDLSERKLAESRLQESEQRFCQFMETLPAAAFIKDSDGKVLFMNRYLADILGVRDWQGKSTLDLLPPRLAEEMLADDERAMAAGYQLTEEQVQGADGQLRLYQTHKFRINRQGAAPLLGGIALDITERKRLEAQIRELAFYDPLTNLPNRRLLFDRLSLVAAAAKRAAGSVALLLIDLDNFKSVNDKHGHDVGDLLLLEVARRIADSVRETDTVARLGGDEFVVLLGDLDRDPATAAEQAQLVAEKILQTAAAPYILKPAPRAADIECRCTVSIGIATVADGEFRQGDILRRADIAMYRAKSAGRNTIFFLGDCAPAASKAF
ncbi:bifunctional diguanylate cyclase/phosphodiesterase [Rhodocyclus tenuis]|uniref:sensor domain-containing protein n=1 Tax=Rhodocyclus tenuis TaxID=1066 RepID=UPI001902C7D9|nr:diguanylate cyclase [Rhodocyclus tenuis]MBK1681093.1 hypothetical protein [Rhodocyclus tenuis]